MSHLVGVDGEVDQVDLPNAIIILPSEVCIDLRTPTDDYVGVDLSMPSKRRIPIENTGFVALHGCILLG